MARMIDIPTKIQKLMTKLLTNGFKAYVIGGAVRDSLMCIGPDDWDIFTDATGEDLKRIFPDCKVIGNEERQQKILTVVVEDTEISTFRKNGNRTETGDSLREHLSTCDFTINAIAADASGRIMCAPQCIKDLEQRLIRFVGSPQDRINEDPIRILRGFRFAAKGFTIHNKSKRMMFSKIDTLFNIPVERIVKESDKAFKSGYPGNYLKLLIKSKLYDYLFPFNQNREFLERMSEYMWITADPYRKYLLYISLSSEEFDQVAKTLKLDNKTIDTVKVLHDNYMEALLLMDPRHTVVDRFRLRKFQYNVGRLLPVLAELMLTVCKVSTFKYDGSIFNARPDMIVPAVTGKFLIDKGIAQGKEMGKILRDCLEIQLRTGNSDPEKIYSLYLEGANNG